MPVPIIRHENVVSESRLVLAIKVSAISRCVRMSAAPLRDTVPVMVIAK